MFEGRNNASADLALRTDATMYISTVTLWSLYLLAYMALGMGYILQYWIYSLPVDVDSPCTLEGLVDWVVKFHNFDPQDLADGSRLKATEIKTKQREGVKVYIMQVESARRF